MVGFGVFHQAGVMPIARDNGGVPYVNLVYRLLSLHGRVHHQDAAEASPRLPFNPQLPAPLAPAADGDQRRASHQRGGHGQVQTRLLGRRRQVRKKEKHSRLSSFTHHHYFSVTPTSVVFGTVYNLQQSLSLLNVSWVRSAQSR